MARAFTSADVIQSNPGTETAVATASPALASPSSDGTGGIVIMGATTQINPPENWHYAAQTGASTYGASVVAVLSRADLLAGEQTWGLDPIAGTPSFCWLAEEWANLSYEPVETSAGSGLGAAPASLASGSTGVFTAEYVVGVAALVVFGGGTGATAWSAVTWSNSFVETDVLQIGDGSPGGVDIQLRVARRYGTLNDTGPWDTTVTFTGGAQTGKTAYLCLAVLRAEDVVVTDPAIVMTGG